MAFTLGRMIKGQMDKEKAIKNFEDGSRLVIVNLRDEIEHLKQFNFQDDSFKNLVVDKWLKDPVELQDPDGEALSKLNWFFGGTFLKTNLISIMLLHQDQKHSHLLGIIKLKEAKYMLPLIRF
ncbi:MAG: hypothetical protein ACTSSN_13865 [Candidatus Heimdallarchaeaceae archaeon]